LQIQSKQFSGSQTDIAKQVNYALKTAAKLVNNNKHMYIINGTMQEELDFIRQALQEDLGIDFETPIAFIIPRIPTALLFGDSSLQSCGGYSFKLKNWWYDMCNFHKRSCYGHFYTSKTTKTVSSSPSTAWNISQLL
jgi:hypothetical protein